MILDNLSQLRLMSDKKNMDDILNLVNTNVLPPQFREMSSGERDSH